MATYYVSAATGLDADSGLTEALAWLTIDKAMNTVVAGDKVWVKADGNYAELVTIDTIGTTTAPIVFEGYTTTLGDGGRATITGSSARANCIAVNAAITTSLYYVFKNIRCTAATAEGLLTVRNHLTLKNCKFDANGTDGCSCYLVSCEGCEFSSNGTTTSHYGLRVAGGGTICVGCTFASNAGIGLYGPGIPLVAVGCVFFSNAAQNLYMGGVDILVTVANCTFDGDAKDSDSGIENSGAATLLAVINTVLYDCTTGWVAASNGGERNISRNNLVNANTTAYTNAATFTGEVTTAPQFVNEVGGADYTPAATSPLLEAGFDGKVPSYMDIGAIQRDAPAAADYPAVGDVELGVVFNGGASTGTFAKPAVGEVKTGIGYGAGGTEFTGTRTHPAVGDVKTAITYGAGGTEFTGTRTHPAVGDVESPNTYGAGGTEFTGTFTKPVVGDVKTGIGYGGGGTEFTGTRTHPVIGKVATGIQYGSGGTEFTGNRTVPAVGDVKTGVTYGELGTEFTGTQANIAGGGGGPLKDLSISGA